ncbi:MAG: 6-carboxytetrahydropterin synthase [Myxococcales bacterium]|nr:6-carboxytetrahydropterin synthase [Myxococcales bacterium]
MSEITCIRRLEWDALHRIPGHEGACRAWHGHRYAAEIHCVAPALDACGRVVDFGVIKQRVGGFINARWDHTALLMRGDPDPTAEAIAKANEAQGRPAFWFDAPPSAETIVAELARIAAELLADTGVRVVRVRLWETPNGSAEWVAG